MVEGERKPSIPVKKVEEDTKSKKLPSTPHTPSFTAGSQQSTGGTGGQQQGMYNYGNGQQFYNNYGGNMMGYGNYMNNYDMMNYYNYMQQFGQMMNPMAMQMNGMMNQMPNMPQVGSMAMPTVVNSGAGGTTVNTINLNQPQGQASSGRQGGQGAEKK